MERTISEGMQRVIRARHPGVVEYVDGEKVEVKLDKKAAIGEAENEDVEITDGGKRSLSFDQI